MNEFKVTVIIPAYNAASYIGKCLESVLNQTYSNKEVIVVDDGSDDNTVDIARSYKDVIVLTKGNGGSSSARNYGIKHARGKYIVFVDSDDYIVEDFISTLVSFIGKTDDGIVISSFLVNGKKEDAGWTYLELTDKSEIFSLFLNKGIHNRIMNKIYPYELIKNIQFPEGQDLMEDAYFTSHVLEKCKKIIRIPYSGYNYIKRDGSLTNKKLTQTQIAGKFSNILEKDEIIAKHITSDEDISLFIKSAFEHIGKAIEQVCNLNQFNIFEKINSLILYMLNTQKLNKDTRKILTKLENCKTPNQMKRIYGNYKLIHVTLKNKFNQLFYILKK